MNVDVMPFLTLFQISDSAFPIGGYTLSNGLETYVQKGIVKDAITAWRYMRNMLLYSIMYTDGAAAKLAWEYTVAGDLESIKRLDELLSAVKTPREIRKGSQRMCVRFIKVVSEFAADGLLREYHELIKGGFCMGHHSIAFGIFTCSAHIPLCHALAAYLYNAAAGIACNCVKLVPLGQMEGQKLLHDAHGLIEDMLHRIDEVSIEDIGMCAMGFDVRAMQHERLYSRLYIS